MTDCTLAETYVLESVTTAIDAVNAMDTFDRQIESIKQAAMADRLILTKSDLVAPETLRAIRKRLADLNPSTRLTVAVNGEVSAAELLSTAFYDPQTKSLDAQAWLNAEAFGHAHQHGDKADATHAHHHTHDDSQAHGDVNRHDHRIKAVCLTIEDAVHGAALDRWLQTLLFLKGPDLLRVKGILNVVGFAGPVVIHGVQHIFHPATMLPKWTSPDRRSQIVFIVRDIEEAALRDTFKMFNDEEIHRAATPPHRIG